MPDRAGQLDAFDDVFLTVSAPQLPLDQWAVERRIVAGDGPRTGPWDPRYAPMSLEPMRAFSDEHVREVVVVSPSQLMKTEFVINCALATSDYGDDCLIFEPDEPLLEDIVAKRIRPSAMALGAAEAPPSDHQKKRDHRRELHVRGRGAITGVTPNMKTGTAARTARVVVVDELDKMVRSDMRVVARERTTTYGADAKVVFVSTPTIDRLGSIWRAWSEGSRGVWRGRCPHCAEHVPMDFEQVHFDRDDAGYWVEGSWVLVCESCGVEWSEPDRLVAAQNGRYIHEHPDHAVRTFRIPGPAHLWRALDDVMSIGAQAYRAAVDEQDWAAYIAWRNGMLALPWDDEFKGLSAKGLEGTVYVPGPRGECDMGPLPDGALVVTAGIDVGARHLKAEWVAWGLDPGTDRIRSWALRWVTLGDEPDDSIDEPELWDQLEAEIQASVWRRGSGRARAARILIDVGHRPEVVRKWCTRRYRASAPRTLGYFDAQVCPARGHHTEKDLYPVNLEIGTSRKKGRPVQVPATVYLQTQQLKERIYDWMEADKHVPHGAERAHQYPSPPVLHGYTPDYFKEFAGERKDPGRTPQGRPVTRWVQRHGWVRHDAWDCRVYALAALYMLAYPAPLPTYLTAKRRKLERAGKLSVVNP